MIEIALQWDGKAYRPFSVEDAEKSKAYKPNQIVAGKITGTRKLRSLQQNKWIHAIFRIVALNTDDPKWDTPEKTKRRVKLAMHFFKDDISVEGDRVYFELRSFAFDMMDAHEADVRYSDAKLICAKKLGVDPGVLQAEAQKE